MFESDDPQAAADEPAWATPPAWGTWDETLQSQSSSALLTAEAKRSLPVPAIVAGVVALALLVAVAVAVLPEGQSRKARLSSSSGPATTFSAPTTVAPTTTTAPSDGSGGGTPLVPAAVAAPPTTATPAAPVTHLAATTAVPASSHPAAAATPAATPATTAAPTTVVGQQTVSSVVSESFYVSGLVVVHQLYSPQAQQAGGLPTSCTPGGLQITAGDGAGTVYATATFGPGTLSSAEADGFLDLRCAYAYKVSGLPVIASYTFTATNGAVNANPTAGTSTQSQSQLEASGGPLLQIENLTCPECDR